MLQKINNVLSGKSIGIRRIVQFLRVVVGCTGANLYFELLTENKPKWTTC